MIEWLKQFPEDTIVEVHMEGYRGRGNFVEFSGEQYSDHFTFMDFTNRNITDKTFPYFGKRILELGSQ